MIVLNVDRCVQMLLACCPSVSTVVNFDQSKLQPRVVVCLQPHGDTLSQLFEFVCPDSSLPLLVE